MGYGCAFMVTAAPPSSSYTVYDVVVLPCATPCTDFTITSGPDAGTSFVALSEECMDWPPEEGRVAPTTAIPVKDREGTIYRPKS